MSLRKARIWFADVETMEEVYDLVVAECEWTEGEEQWLLTVEASYEDTKDSEDLWMLETCLYREGIMLKSSTLAENVPTAKVLEIARDFIKRYLDKNRMVAETEEK